MVCSENMFLEQVPKTYVNARIGSLFLSKKYLYDLFMVIA